MRSPSAHQTLHRCRDCRHKIADTHATQDNHSDHRLGHMLKPIEAENLKALPGIRHGFFTREGGVSEGIYAGLNCGRGSDDDPGHVAENRARVARHLGANAPEIATPYQVHGATSVVLDRLPDRAALPKADAIVTATPGLAVGVVTADCGPVLLADPDAGIVAAAHAGWRGAVGGVLESAIAEMVNLGAHRQRIHAAFGPCIGQSSYEVGPEFEAEFTEKNPDFCTFFTVPYPGGRARFDLAGFIAQELQRCGIATVEPLLLCTHDTESLFYSYRRSQARQEPDYGRQISAIVVA